MVVALDEGFDSIGVTGADGIEKGSDVSAFSVPPFAGTGPVGDIGIFGIVMPFLAVYIHIQTAYILLSTTK